jgi:predicted deacetylase
VDPRSFIVSLHDFHPGSLGVIRDQVRAMQEVGVNRFSILVVPEFHHGRATLEHSESVAFLEERLEQGDELVLHGFYHDRVGLAQGSYFWTRIYSNDEAEFFDIGRVEADERLRKGRELWVKRGWPLTGFIAPGWLMPGWVEGVLREHGFAYTTRLREVLDLCSGQVTVSQSLCYSTRSWWRWRASLVWNRSLFERVKQERVIRLGLHPADWNVGAVKEQIVRLSGEAVEGGFEPRSYQDYVAM